ncbi:MAG: hypothetical protein FWG08_04395 [Propionibacteriaceae bacterium]|nr:hypothetical protein [Propionibacteriaceae bacterium]
MLLETQQRFTQATPTFRDHLIAINCALILFMGGNRFPGLGDIDFSDIHVLVGVVLLVGVIVRTSRIQVLLLIMSVAVPVWSIFLHVWFDPEYLPDQYMVYIVKVPVYAVFLTRTYSYVRDNNLFLFLIKWLVPIAVLFSSIGIYIYIVQIFNLSLPYDFFWTFTRDDFRSYTFGTTDVIRLRSMSREPSYFGQLVCLVLGIMYASRHVRRNSTLAELVILLAGLLTFSTATWPILMYLIAWRLLGIVRGVFTVRGVGRTLVGGLMVLVAVVAVVAQDLFRHSINVAITGRLDKILEGEDGSATSRLVGSWAYVDDLVLGNGIGATPPIWNNYAYVISDLGVVAFLVAIGFTMWLIMRHWPLGLLFIGLCFARGGYLSASFWQLTLYVVITTVCLYSTCTIREPEIEPLVTSTSGCEGSIQEVSDALEPLSHHRDLIREKP